MAEAERPGRLPVTATTTGDIEYRAPPLPDTSSLRIVAGMRQGTFMDSSGINILIAAHRTLTEAGGWLRLAGTPTGVMRTIGIAGPDSAIDCHETLSRALKS
ncbi:hypothetical protein ADL06_17835 [Streptomyces sp. NRRL F-6491]|nr:hypothetical protein ADL06_17835 [Streptomyces sp. NRRL F-6491]KOX49260.1 hypothetical protein ADL08_08870 [Streptomyces sp. NRRL F-6492]